MVKLRPVIVPPGENQVYEEVDQAENRQQQIEQVHMIPVNVVTSQPPSAPRDVPRCSIHDLHEYGAEEVAERHRAP